MSCRDDERVAGIPDAASEIGEAANSLSEDSAPSIRLSTPLRGPLV